MHFFHLFLYHCRYFLNSTCISTGYYCPRKSTVPTPCPAGTYNPLPFGKNLKSACKSCPADHFQYKEAQTACFACGEEATNEVTGQDTCTCNYANRDFQVSFLYMNFTIMTNINNGLIILYLYK